MWNCTIARAVMSYVSSGTAWKLLWLLWKTFTWFFDLLQRFVCERVYQFKYQLFVVILSYCHICFNFPVSLTRNTSKQNVSVCCERRTIDTKILHCHPIDSRCCKKDQTVAVKIAFIDQVFAIRKNPKKCPKAASCSCERNSFLIIFELTWAIRRSSTLWECVS